MYFSSICSLFPQKAASGRFQLVLLHCNLARRVWQARLLGALQKAADLVQRLGPSAQYPAAQSAAQPGQRRLFHPEFPRRRLLGFFFTGPAFPQLPDIFRHLALVG